MPRYGRLPGSTKARKRIVSASLESLGRLASETRRSLWGTVAGQDMDLALEIGTAYLKVARVQGVPINSNLGQFQQASESLAKADGFVESVLGDAGFRAAQARSTDFGGDRARLDDSGSIRISGYATPWRSAARQRNGWTRYSASPGFSPEEAGYRSGTVCESRTDLLQSASARRGDRLCEEIRGDLACL